MNKKFLVWYTYFILFFVNLFSQDFGQGVDYLKNNFPEKALPIFFAETEKAGGNPKAYLYLSVACIQMQKYGDAIVWLQKGKAIDPTDKYLYSYNLGNAYYMQGAYDFALSAYMTAIAENRYYPPTLLNKANTEMKLGAFDAALASYKEYLSLAPATVQAPAIRQMISLLQGEKEVKESEALIKQANERAVIERERIRVEKERAEEQARIDREKALLDAVNDNLSDADSAKSISVGAEDTINYNEEEGSLE